MRGDNLLVYVGDKIVGRLEPVRTGEVHGSDPRAASSGECGFLRARAGRLMGNHGLRLLSSGAGGVICSSA